MLKNDEQIDYKCFEESFEGVIESQIALYQNNVEDVFDEWVHKKEFFRYRE